MRDVLNVLVVWLDRKVKNRKYSWRKARDETWDTPADNTCFGGAKMTMQFLSHAHQLCGARL